MDQGPSLWFPQLQFVMGCVVKNILVGLKIHKYIYIYAGQTKENKHTALDFYITFDDTVHTVYTMHYTTTEL